MNEGNEMLQESIAEQSVSNQIHYDRRVKALEQAFEAGDLDGEYAEYIMQHSAGERLICNGDDLIRAMESGYCRDDFIDELAGK